MIKTCPVCGKEFKARHKKQQFCCRTCADNAKKKDLTGQKFGKWTVLKFDKKSKGNTYWLCQCECGTVRSVSVQHFKHGGSNSCGCTYNKKLLPGEGKKLPHYKRISRILSAMFERCENPKNTNYYLYGSRDICVCKEWHNYMTFYKWAMDNGYADGLTIDRIDNNGNYEPSNCRWVTKAEQNRNTRRNIIVTINDETHCLSEWCRIFNKSVSSVMSRVFDLKWNIAKALEVPVKSPHKEDK